MNSMAYHTVHSDRLDNYGTRAHVTDLSIAQALAAEHIDSI
jgi:hypothetical protein